jgi:hypothetical protein
MFRAQVAGERRKLLYPDNFFGGEDGLEDLSGVLLTAKC